MPANNSYGAAAWGGSKFFDLKVPSGGLVQCQKLSPEKMITQGILNQADILSFTADQEVIGPAQGRKRPQDRQPKKLTKAQQEQQNIDQLLADPKQMATMMSMVDKIVAVAVVQPVIHVHFRTEKNSRGEDVDIELGPEERDPDYIYTDSIPTEDKMEIFQRSFGGVQAMQSFRDESDEDAGTVEDVEGAEDTTE